MRFSARTAWDLQDSDLTRAVREARAQGRPLIDLTVSNPTVCGFPYETEKILGALQNGAAMTYDPDARGIVRAREAVAAYYAQHGAQVHAGDVLLTTSTSEAYSFLFRLLCDPGDTVLVAQPGYPLFDFIAALDDVRLESYPVFYDHGWWIDFAAFEQRIGPRTRALVLVHPNNPTGHATSAAELGRLQALCARHRMALIVDEVFLDYGLTAPVQSVASTDAEALTFVVSGLSKVAALPQMKVGWIVCRGPQAPRAEALARLEVVADTFLSMNGPAQHALPAWLETRFAIQRHILERVRGNVAAASRLRTLSALQVEAGWSLILRLPQFATHRAADRNQETLSRRLLDEADVLVHPGSFYGLEGDHLVVASTLGTAENFADGLNRMARWCECQE